jgi:hypothetical protein
MSYFDRCVLDTGLDQDPDIVWVILAELDMVFVGGHDPVADVNSVVPFGEHLIEPWIIGFSDISDLESVA